MPTGTFGDVTDDANRAIFLKRKATAFFNRVERLVDSLSSAALTSRDESGLHVRLELIDELHLKRFSVSSKNWISRKLKVT